MKKITLLLTLVFCVAITQAQLIYTIAGNGVQGYNGDGGQATAAELDFPSGVGLDASGNVYIAQAPDNYVRMVNTSGIITTYAGNGATGYTGDGGPATAAELNYPTGIMADAAGNIYVSDYGNNVVRKINTSGIISTFAGNGYPAGGFSGDGGQATAAELNFPSSTAMDAAGNMYISDNINNCIRKVNTSGIISTVAGSIAPGYSGDGGPATSAELNNPWGVTVDGSGNIYIGDQFNYRVRKVNTSGIISTYAGTGVSGFSGDGGQATAAAFTYPAYLVIDASGNLLVSDEGDGHIRKIDNSGIVTTIAGGGSSVANGVPATTATLGSPYQIALDKQGNLYIADFNFYTVRKVDSISCTNNFNEPICIVTIDTITNKDEVIWGRTNSPPQGGYGNYDIYRDSTLGFTLTHTQPLNVLSEFIDPNSAPLAGPVSYEISTVDSCGQSAMSSTHTSVYLTTTSALNVYILNWTAYVGFTPSKYRIFRGPSMSTLVQIDSVPSTVLTFHDTLPPLGSFYVVEAVNPAGACIPTAKIKGHNISATTLSGSYSNGFNTKILGIQNMDNPIYDVNVYPNPSNGIFTLNYSMNADCKVTTSIIDELGRIVYDNMEGKNAGKISEQINLENLAAGIYSVRMQTSGGIIVKKLVVMRR